MLLAASSLLLFLLGKKSRFRLCIFFLFLHLSVGDLLLETLQLLVYLLEECRLEVEFLSSGR